jgi:site-specific recombinase XerD
MPHSKSPFLAQVSALLRAKHYSLRTEEAYVGWIKRFILFHGKQHPETLGERQVESFLTSLAVDHEVSASTQNQALNALAFLHKQVLRREDLGDFGQFVRANRPRRLSAGRLDRL